MNKRCRSHFAAVLVLASGLSPLRAGAEAVAPAWTDTNASSVWQWSVPAPTIPDRRASLWIPPNCSRVRGIVIGMQNMLEKPLFERIAFRRACADNGLAIVLVCNGFDKGSDEDKPHPPRSPLGIFLNANFPKGDEDPQGAGRDLQNVLNALADESGYQELRTAPLIPVGHSSAGSFVWHLYRWDASRIFAMMPFKTGIKDDGPSGIPIFNVESEWFDYGNGTSNVSSKPSDIEHQASVRRKNPDALFGFYVDIGAGHCDVSDDCIPDVALFLKKVVAARIPESIPIGQPVKLKAIDIKKGWLIAPADLGKGVEPVAYAAWKGDPKDGLWYLDRELASAVQSHMSKQMSKNPQQMNFVNDKGVAPTNGGTFSFSPKWLDNVGTFKVEARFIDTLSAKTDLFPPGTPLGNSGEKILFRVNSGALRQVGPDTFRVIPHAGPIVPQGNPWEPTVIAYALGTNEYRPTERPGHVNVSVVQTGGSPQTIDFTQIPNQPAGSTAEVPLKATATSGLPVQFFVLSGPVELSPDGNSLKLLPPPPRAQYPIRVVIGAWQWGRDKKPQFQTAPRVYCEFFIQKPGSPATRPPLPTTVPSVAAETH